MNRRTFAVILAAVLAVTTACGDGSGDTNGSSKNGTEQPSGGGDDGDGRNGSSGDGDSEGLVPSGEPLNGAPSTEEAATGQPDTLYNDVVRGVDDNFYRFEVEPGSDIRARMTMAAVPGDEDCGFGRYFRLYLVGAGGEEYGRNYDSADLPVQDGAAVELETDVETIAEDEIWAWIEFSACDYEEVEFEVALELAVAD